MTKRFAFIFLSLLVLYLPVSALTVEGKLIDHPVLRDYAQFEAAEALFSSGQYAAAIPEYQKVISLYPESILLPRAKLSEGKCHFCLKNYSLAIKSFSELVKTYPQAKEAAEARFLIAKAHEVQGKWKEAYLAYEETDLYHPLSYFGGKSRQAIAALKKSHRKKLPRFRASAEALFKKGMSYFNEDNFEAAANIFSRLAREFPKSKYVGEAWLMLGRAELQTSGKYESALSDLERAAALNGRAYYYLGLAHARRGNYDRAISSMKKVYQFYPDSGLADDAAYWVAYYQEAKGELKEALLSYYNILNKYPHSKVVPAAIWRIGRTYYWNNEFKNASTYFHLAQLYPAGEDSPRCYFFEARALEHQGNHTAAQEIYRKLIERFDHTYYSYRAKDKLNHLAPLTASQNNFKEEDLKNAFSALDDKNREELSAIMEIWEQSNAEILREGASQEASLHLEKYKELMNLGLTGYAADEARFLVNITSDAEKDPLQIKLGQALMQAGEYRTPLRFADRKVKSAVISGRPESVPQKTWQMAYPKGYWKQVSQHAKDYGLDPFLVLAVIREESRFNPRATSRSNAKGLMQIIPRTGKGIAQKLTLHRYRTSRLYEPSLNVKMGTYYLSKLIGNFKNNLYLALAGYNGGPNRIKSYVQNWYNGNLEKVEVDEFVESIPKRETRLYVQKVMGSYFEYKRLYERKRG